MEVPGVGHNGDGIFTSPEGQKALFTPVIPAETGSTCGRASPLPHLISIARAGCPAQYRAVCGMPISQLGPRVFRQVDQHCSGPRCPAAIQVKAVIPHHHHRTGRYIPGRRQFQQAAWVELSGASSRAPVHPRRQSSPPGQSLPTSHAPAPARCGSGCPGDNPARPIPAPVPPSLAPRPNPAPARAHAPATRHV